MRYRTKGGETIEMRHCRQDPNDRTGHDAGYVIRRVDAFIEGNHVGYLKIAYVPSNRLSEVFPTLWHWVRRTQGWMVNLDDPVKLWCDAHRYAQVVPASQPHIAPWSLTRKVAPDLDVIQADLDLLEDRPLPYGSIRERYQSWCRDQVDRPHVDYIRVFDKWRRQGIGTTLLDAGARWMADTYGLPLYGSSLQSNEAKAVWAALLATGEYPADRRRVPWGSQEVPVLDYTR